MILQDKKNTLTAQEIRSKFLNFFKARGHHIENSGPLVPQNDPTLLFTNAGMVQFKKLFLGDEKKEWQRAATCQKCLRVSGKHNDLENVGRTARHHTFFEMLGNFSFGNYFKREAITWAWEFVTKELGLPKEKLWVTVFRDDDEAAALWEEIAELPKDRIVKMDEKDNFWTMGDTGPCGPCSEIYYDQGSDMACGNACGIGQCDCDRFLEIWNLVFTQFDQTEDGRRVLLAAPNIDTGMGLERIAAVCQGRQSNFDCDLFQQIIGFAADIAGVKYSESAPDTNDIDTALRVIADHARAAAFLIAEGILPSNENRGYVLRRLIRRALRFAALMGVNEPFMHKVAVKVTEIMGEAYPELARNAQFIEKAVYEEERRFAQTLENGLKLLEDELLKLEKDGKNEISGETCFKLYDTYGFPLDIISDIAEKRSFAINVSDFEKLMSEQRKRARTNQKKTGMFAQVKSGALIETCEKLSKKGYESQFTGYAELETKTSVLAIIDSSGNLVNELGESQTGFVMTAKTPFYAESGGQAGDSGILRSATGAARVLDTIRPVAGIILMNIQVDAGEILADQQTELRVDSDTRMAAARNHTCTHLLHAALRRILGEHVKQAGSMVDSKRLRFDFSHFSALTKEELSAVEREVNRAIMADLPVTACEMQIQEALEKGAMALFSEKYGDKVRVLTVGNPDEPAESIELCGGTHLSRTGQAGSFFIASESAVASGVRRIEAITGWNAYGYAIGQRAEIHDAADILKCAPSQLKEKMRQLAEELKSLRKAMEKTKEPEMADAEIAKTAEKINGITFIAKRIDGQSIKHLRELMDKLRGPLDKNAIICLASAENGKMSILLYVSKDLHEKFKAPELIGIVASHCGGAGGGRPDMAQAGGTNPDGFAKGIETLRSKLGG